MPELNRCPYCERPAEAVTPAMGRLGRLPAAGAVSLCFGCGQLAVFTGRGLEVRAVTPDELGELVARPDVQAALAAWRAVLPDA